MVLVGIGTWGQYTYTFPTGGTVYTNGVNPETKTLGAYSWTLSTTPSGASFRGVDATKGQQFGSAGTPATSATLSTSGISGTITTVKVTTSGAASVVATVGVTVGGIVFSPTSSSISATSTEYTFTGSATGTIVISWAQTSSKALYIAKLDVTSASGYTVSYSGNTSTSGSVPTDATSYASGATVTVKTNSGSLAKTGYTFGGWNTLANGTGVNYAAGTGTFSITANTTLYAKWNINQYNVSYNGNGNDSGSAPAMQTADYNTNVILANNSGSLTKAGFTFNGWNTNSSGTGTHYNSGATFTIPSSDTPLYAEWLSNAPAITTSGTLSAVNTVYGTASTNTTFTVSATNLTNSLVITPPSGFEISDTAGSGFTTSLNLGSANRTNTTIYVRLAANTPVGSYNGNIALVSGSTNASIATVNSTVSAKALTITGIAGVEKIYNGNTAATVTGTEVLNGIVGSDVVTISGTPNFNFTNANVGTGKTITASGYTLSGTSAGNYTVTQPTGLTASITAKALSISAPTIACKVYDTFATTGTITVGTLSGLIGSETLSVTASGTFDAPNAADAGTGKPATVVYTLGNGTNGGLATNYSLANGTGTGDVTKATPTYAPTTISLNVNGTQTIGSSISNSPGILTFSSLNTAIATVDAAGLVTGLAVGSTTINITQAASTNYTPGSTSVAVTVSAIAYVNGDYRSTSNGNWHSTAASNTATWEQFNGTSWISSSAPGASAATLGTKKVYINNLITLVGTNTAPYVVILENGELHSNVTVTFGNLLVKSGGEFYRENNATGMNTSGVFEIEDGGNVYITQTNTALPSIWAGTEKFHPNSNVIIKRLDAGAVITDTSNFTPFTDGNGNSAYFGNLIIDSSVDVNVLDGSSGVAASSTWITNGDLILRSGTTGTSAFRFVNGMGTTSTTALPYTIGGNFIIESGFVGSATLRNASITTNLKVKKDFIMNGASIFRMTGAIITTAVNLYVDGNVKLNDTSTFLFSSSVNNVTPILSMYLKGDIAVASGATFTNLTTAANNANLYFIDNGDGTTDALTQTIDIAPTSSSNAKINFSLIWPAFPSIPYVKLVKDLYVGTNSTVTVRTNATLDFGFNGNTALNLIANGTGQVFSAASGSTLKITSPLGITSGAIPDYTGNVQIGATAANRVFNAGATYHYIGKSATPQVTGNAIATSASPLTGKIIVDMESAVGQFAASASKTINAPGTLEIKTGVVTDDSSNGFIGTGNLIMTSANGKYITSRTGTQPDLSGTYTLTNGTIEFANSQATAASIRVTPEYYNINVSGSNVQSGGKNLVVNNLLKVNSASGVFTVPDELDTANPYVVTAKKGIQVVAGGKALFKNNANLIQDADAINGGDIVAQRIAKLKFVSVAAQADYNYWSSPVADQKLLYNAATLGTSFSPGTPNNRIFQYKESSDTFVATTDPNFVAGKGYAVRAENAQNGSTYTADGNPKVFEFTGTPNNGNVTTPVLSWKDATHGYNLVGNPYPSIIDFNLLQTANSDLIYKTAYFWTNVVYTPSQQGSSATGYTGNNYATFNGTGGTPAGGSLVEPTKYIKTGQGFIVQTKKAGALQFTNATRAIGISPFFNNKLDEEKNRFWLTLSTPSNMTNTILVGYVEGATNAFEKDYDAPMLTDGSDSFYSILGNQKLIIQGKEDSFTDSDIIPLGAKYYETGTHKIQLYKKEGIFNGGQNVYLKDKLLNKTIDLTDGDYTFQAVKGTDFTRFEVVYKENATLGVNNGIKSDFSVYRDGANYVVNSSRTLGKIQVYDVAGRLIISENTTNKNIKLDFSGLVDGVYIIKAENSGDIRTKKVQK